MPLHKIILSVVVAFPSLLLLIVAIPIGIFFVIRNFRRRKLPGARKRWMTFVTALIVFGVLEYFVWGLSLSRIDRTATEAGDGFSGFKVGMLKQAAIFELTDGYRRGEISNYEALDFMAQPSNEFLWNGADFSQTSDLLPYFFEFDLIDEKNKEVCHLSIARVDSALIDRPIKAVERFQGPSGYIPQSSCASEGTLQLIVPGKKVSEVIAILNDSFRARSISKIRSAAAFFEIQFPRNEGDALLRRSEYWKVHLQPSGYRVQSRALSLFFKDAKIASIQEQVRRFPMFSRN